MVKKSIDAKVRPVGNPSLEKASLVGAARVYISKDSLIALTGGLESGKLCVVERLDGEAALPGGPLRREASLWALPEKNLSPNVVMMTRAYQEATGFRLGDQVRVALAEAPLREAGEVVLQEVGEEREPEPSARHPPSWEFSISMSLERAEQVYPGMVLEGVSINKLRRSFKIITVDSQPHNLARFSLASTAVRILQSSEQGDVAPADPEAGDLAVSGVPGLSSQVTTLNRFLRGFCRPFWVKDERESCGFVIHGGRGTGKSFILGRVAETRWGTVHWVKPSDKLSVLRETFKLARAQQPSLVFIDGLEDLISKDRANRDAVVDTLCEELDALSAEARANGALPRVVVIATCLDYMSDVPGKLQKRSRLRDNVALPIPRAAERLEILEYLNPPLREDERDACLRSVAQKTHAFTGDDLANLVLNAKRILGTRLDEAEKAGTDAATAAEEQKQQQKYCLSPSDMEQSLRTTRPTAMHDVNLKPPTIHWQDVGGQASLKKTLARMIRHARDARPAARHVLRNPPKGLLLYGPPGCSKTLSAQAMATESGFNFFAVKGAELLNMYVGESERAVRTLFERARAAAPAIIFFDEIDSIGGQRGPSSSSSSTSSGARSGAVNMLTTLLTEMDGFEALTGVLVLAATNRPEAMDPALLRPGRFDQLLYVGPPDSAAREAVFAVHLRGLAVAADVDASALAALAEGLSGAEIRAVCNEAGLAVLDRYDDEVSGGGGADGSGNGGSGDEEPKLEIRMADLVEALDRTPRGITKNMLDGYERWSRQFKKT